MSDLQRLMFPGAASHPRRAARFIAFGSPAPVQRRIYDVRRQVCPVRRRLYTRDGGECFVCGVVHEFDWELHHLIPRSIAPCQSWQARGWRVERDVENFRTLCSACHKIASKWQRRAGHMDVANWRATRSGPPVFVGFDWRDAYGFRPMRGKFYW